MMFRVIILSQVRRDIDRNANWWAEHHSVEQAIRWSDAMYGQIETLADSPDSCGLSAECGKLSYEIRDKLLGLGSRPSYRAVFTIQGDAVYVLTVRRAAQDVLRQDEIDPPPSQ